MDQDNNIRPEATEEEIQGPREVILEERGPFYVETEPLPF
jgi:hypothetical protein